MLLRYILFNENIEYVFDHMNILMINKCKFSMLFIFLYPIGLCKH